MYLAASAYSIQMDATNITRITDDWMN